MYQTTKSNPIRPDARLLIQQFCANCNGTGDLSDGSICPICYGTRRVTLHVTLAELSAALMEMLPSVARQATGARNF